jgi:hypothetical protein
MSRDCIRCGRRIADVLWRLGSTLRHDCRAVSGLDTFFDAADESVGAEEVVVRP